MNIFTLVSRNFRRRPQTFRFPDRPHPAGEFRGLVRIDPDKCLTCGICDYVCVSGAITVVSRENDCAWSYDPGRCTFCGRCVDHCPGEALSHEEDRAPVYESQGALSQTTIVEYPACVECGRPALPFSERLLAIAHEEISDELRHRTRLCDRCRRRRSQAALRKGIDGYEGPAGPRPTAPDDPERSPDGR